MKHGGWKSDYDYESMSNTDKYFGRKLHVQDNFWRVGKPLLYLFWFIVIVCVIKGDIGHDIRGIIGFFNILNS